MTDEPRFGPYGESALRAFFRLEPREFLQMVTVWRDEQGNPLCIGCTVDARRGGADIKVSRAAADKYDCAYCHERIA
jgi:hypothetical protein